MAKKSVSVSRMKPQRSLVLDLFYVGFIILILVSLTSCAGLETKGDLPDVFLRKRNNSGKSVQISRIHYFDSGEEFSSHDSKGSRFIIKDVFMRSGQFNGVSIFNANEEKFGLFKYISKEEKNKFQKDAYDGVSDYQILIESRSKHPGLHGGGYFHWMLLHMISLGFLPVYMDNSIEWEVSVLNAKKELIQRFKVVDKSSRWFWAPLFFFNGFKLITIPNTMENKTVEIGAKNIIEKLDLRNKK